MAWRNVTQQLSVARAAIQQIFAWNLKDAFDVWRSQASLRKAVTVLRDSVVAHREQMLLSTAVQVHSLIVLVALLTGSMCISDDEVSFCVADADCSFDT